MLILSNEYPALILAFKRLKIKRLSGIICFIIDYLQRNKVTFLCALLTLSGNSTAVERSDLKFSTGAEYITGDYGGTRSIEQLYIPFTISYTSNKYGLRLTVPYISLTAPTGTIQTDGTIVPGTGPDATESGMGDVIVGATYRDAFSSENSSDVAIDFTVKIKMGTADVDKGLGSGEDDYILQAETYKFLDRMLLFGVLGYKFRGDPPGVNLNDSLIAFAGGNYRLNPEFKTGVDLYFQEKLLSGNDDQVELSVFLGYKLNNAQYLRAYLIKGFGDASPDWGAGLNLSIMKLSTP